MLLLLVNHFINKNMLTIELILLYLGIPMALAPGSFCAMHRLLNRESGEESQCSIHDMRWSCCRLIRWQLILISHNTTCYLSFRKGEKSSGCTFKCTCGQIWGNSQPCILIKHPDPNAAKAMKEYEVFKKEHSLIDFDINVERQDDF